MADINFFYGLAYEDDRLFNASNDTLDLLAQNKIPLYANVISRLELIDLIFRKQVTLGCIEMFNHALARAHQKDIFKLLKYIRDKDTEAKRNGESYKIDERRLKSLRKIIDNEYDITNWRSFCSKYVGAMLTSEWTLVEEDLGLNFIEIMEGTLSPFFNSPLYWKDMVEVMGTHGQRGPDAMIINLFSKSNFPLLVTSDSDFESCFSDSLQDYSHKAIYLLQ
ncbi:MAG: hypothetical protein ACXWRZ_07000 [Bdellovibrio sp.]